MSSLRKFLKLVHGLRNAEHFGFYGYVVRLYTPYRALLAELTVVWDAFHVLFEKEDEIFKRNPKQEETGSIRSACEEMHSAFMLIKRTVEAASYDASPTVKAASEKLAFVLGNYVKLPSVAMNEASALAINLVQDLRLPANAPAVATLGLGTHIDRLEETNEAFQELYLERAKEQESLAEQGNMREIRPLVDKAFDAFAQTLDSARTMAVVSGQTAKAATLGEVIEGINGIILQYEHTYARRSPGAVSGKEGGGGTTPPAPPAPPEPPAPVLQTASQEININGIQMSIVMSDAAAFAQALYPAAQGGILWLRSAAAGVEPQEAAFTIDGFLTGVTPAGEEPPAASETPNGFTASAPANSVLLSLEQAPPAEAWVEKDGLTLARISGLVYGGMFTLDVR